MLSTQDLDDNFDGNPLATKYENFSTNAHLEFRPNENTTGFISGGFAQGGALFFNSQGAGYQDGEDYWAQARVQSGGFFGLVSYNYKSGGGRETLLSYMTLVSDRLRLTLLLKRKYNTILMYPVS